MLRALALTLLASQAVRPFADERVLLDRRLEALRRVLPDGANAGADAALVREQAEGSGLARVQVQARGPAEAGTRGELVLELTAIGAYGEIDRFFRKVASSHRLIDVESATLTAAAGGVIQLSAVFRVAYWPAKAPLPPPPEVPKSRTSGLPRPTLETYLRDQALAYAKSEVVAARRRARRTPRLFLSELAAVSRERPVVIGYAAFADKFTIRGVALGEGPLRAFEARLERGFLQVSEFLMARQGACYRFEAHGQTPHAGPDAELPVPGEDPFDDVASCRADRDAERTTLVKGRPPAPKGPPRGPLTLRLRDVDMADVFQSLALVGVGGFVVDGDVAGQASVELVQTTLDEALGEIRRASKLEMSDAGVVRRVSRTKPRAPERPLAIGGPLASFALKRAEVRDLLAAMAEIDTSLASLGPAGFLGRVSVWTRDVPLEALRTVVLESAGLGEKVEEGRRILERATGTAETPLPVARGDQDADLALRPEDLTVDELELCGIAMNGERATALAYAPNGQMLAYAPGSRLFDGVVRSVNEREVVIETEEGPLRLSLAPLAR